MKKLILSLGLASLLFPLMAHAESSVDKLVKEAEVTSYAKVNKSTEAVSIRLKYSGSSTEAYVSVQDTQIIFQAPNSTRDTTIGQVGRFDLSLSTVDTIGELCDAINAGKATHDYECFMEDAKRDDNANLLGNVISTPTLTGGDLKANNGYEVLFDHAGGDDINGPAIEFQTLGITPESGRGAILKKCEALVAGNGSLVVYGRLKKNPSANGKESVDGLARDDSTKVLDLPVVSSITLVTNFVQSTGTGTLAGATFNPPAQLLPAEGGIEFDRDAHVVVRAGDGVTVQNVATRGTFVPRISCVWDEK